MNLCVVVVRPCEGKTLHFCSGSPVQGSLHWIPEKNKDAAFCASTDEGQPCLPAAGACQGLGLGPKCRRAGGSGLQQEILS